MTKLAREILAERNAAGPDSYLWMQTLGDTGDVILWPSEEASENDPGANAISRWTVDAETMDDLMGKCDEVY